MDFLSIFVNKMDKEPLYYQLYKKIVQKIKNNEIQSGEKLPSKRQASVQWGISVNTVDQAYQMLVAEGYVNAYAKSGFIVNEIEKPVKIEKHIVQENITQNETAQEWDLDFGSAATDPNLFPSKTWNRMFREVVTQEPELFGHGETFGDKVLRVQIAEYLNRYRAVSCSADQIVIGAGLEVLLSFFANMFPSQKIAMEDPGYKKAVQIVKNSGLQIQPVPVDEDGMQVGELEESNANIVYLTPSHQFPTGGTMPIARRMQILQWAKEKNAILLEDDYDSEYRFEGKPLPSLQGLDNGQHVVYIGSFSRSIAPSLRIAYMVLPYTVLEKWKNYYNGYSCTVSRIEQHTLARFMQEGHFYRGLNRKRNQYKKRCLLCIQEIKNNFADESYLIKNTHTGVYFLLYLKECDQERIKEQAKKYKIKLHFLNEYALTEKINEKYKNNIIVGYGGIKENEIGKAVETLAKMIVDSQNKKSIKN